MPEEINQGAFEQITGNKKLMQNTYNYICCWNSGRNSVYFVQKKNEFG